MKQSEINFKIQLDDNSIPEQISWSATDNPNEGIEETKAILVATWDPYHKGTLALPLWTKDMEVLDMKRFFIEIMGTVGDAALQATLIGRPAATGMVAASNTTGKITSL